MWIVRPAMRTALETMAAEDVSKYSVWAAKLVRGFVCSWACNKKWVHHRSSFRWIIWMANCVRLYSSTVSPPVSSLHKTRAGGGGGRYWTSISVKKTAFSTALHVGNSPGRLDPNYRHWDHHWELWSGMTFWEESKLDWNQKVDSETLDVSWA